MCDGDVVGCERGVWGIGQEEEGIEGIFRDGFRDQERKREGS